MSDAEEKSEQLDLLGRYIMDAEALILEQKIIISRIRESGRDTTKAETFLEMFVETLQNMQSRQKHLLSELDKRTLES